MPNSIQELGDGFFTGHDIQSIDFLEGLIKIDDSAFRANNISIIDLPHSLYEIGHKAFTLNSFWFSKQGRKILVQPLVTISVVVGTFFATDKTPISSKKFSILGYKFLKASSIFVAKPVYHFLIFKLKR